MIIDPHIPSSSTCPQCGSSRIGRTHSRGLYEKLLKKFNHRVYFCKECSWRGRLKVKRRKRPSMRAPSFSQIMVIALTILIIVYLIVTLSGIRTKNWFPSPRKAMVLSTRFV